MIYEDDNSYPKAILDIRHIMFPNLKGIYLYNNNIESIEVLSSMWMPSMARLIFGIYWLIQPTTV